MPLLEKVVRWTVRKWPGRAGLGVRSSGGGVVVMLLRETHLFCRVGDARTDPDNVVAADAAVRCVQAKWLDLGRRACAH